MDKNKDGVVTLEEFVLACQEVGSSSFQHAEAQSTVIKYLPANSALMLQKCSPSSRVLLLDFIKLNTSITLVNMSVLW